ncbi:MAG: carbonic anhydrase family protein [Hyphomonadaceae bacterium]|nr:carbonic anhydrase family protein [Hyphomonadaceae bacterium]
MRFKTAASALALMLAACGGGASENAHQEDSHGQAAEHADAGNHGPTLGPADAHAAATPHAAADASAHWDYADQAGWTHVAGLCATGHEQSPINLSSAAPMAETPDLAPRYLTAAGTFVNNGHTLQFTPENANAMLTIGQDAYAFAQFHFHSPAEHTLDRRAYPLELHFVHRNSAGQLAVVGVFIEEGAENPALAALLTALPVASGDQSATHVEIDMNTLLPTDRAYYSYAGSLTTPPCAEGVRWNVLRTPLQASAAQVAALREALGASSRHVQPLGQRTVLLGS